MVHLELLVTAGSANDSLHEGLSDKVLYWALLLGVGNARKLLDPAYHREQRWGNGHTRIGFLGDKA